MALALGVQALLGPQRAVTLGSGELPGRLQPGLVLPIQRLPLPGRVLAGLPGLLPGAGFSLPGAGQLGLGSTDRRRGLLTGLIAFGPCGLSDPGGFGGQPVSAGQGGFRIRAGTGNFLSQLPAGLGGLLTSAAGPFFGGLPAAMRGLGRFQRCEHLLLGLGSTRLRSHRTRLGAAPGRLSLRQLRGHHFRVQSRDLPARQRDQRPGLPDQRLERAERVSSLPRRHRVPITARRPRSVMETTRARITAEHPGPATPGHRNQVPAARPPAATLARLPAQGRAAGGQQHRLRDHLRPICHDDPFPFPSALSSPGK